MTNNHFECYPLEKKKAKLKNVLKAKTREYLTEDELNAIIDAVKVKRQYQVKMYFDKESFKNTLIYPKLGKAEVVLGNAVIGDKIGDGRLVDEKQPTVVIVRRSNCSPENQIHIFVPKQRMIQRLPNRSTSFHVANDCSEGCCGYQCSTEFLNSKEN